MARKAEILGSVSWVQRKVDSTLGTGEKIGPVFYERKLSAETEETKIGRYKKGKLTAGTGGINCQQIQEWKTVSTTEKENTVSK